MNAITKSSSQSLDTDILLELDKIQKGSVKRRLTNELVVLANKGACIHVEYINTNIEFVTITIVLKGEDNVYHFDVTHDYPFKPPKSFRINYKNYKQYLKIDSHETLSQLKLYNGINCLCCHSISCGNKWAPVMRLYDFINEYKKMKKYRRDIINRLLAQKIIDKYLYYDANLVEWLI